MKVLIIEDEPLAAQHLKKLILQYESHIEVVGIEDSVSGAIKWLENHPRPDLIFLDIQLADGISFSIFEQVQVDSPVIFTTAFDEYAIRAFKLNSVDYLLKPLDYDELASAMDKYVKLYRDTQRKSVVHSLDITSLREIVLGERQDYKSRFVVKMGEHLHSIPVEDILYFYSEDKISLFKTREDKRFIIDFTLGEIEEKVDPKLFFRLNRKYLVQHNAILDIVSFSNRRLKVGLKYATDTDILVSRERVNAFKEWLDQ